MHTNIQMKKYRKLRKVYKSQGLEYSLIEIWKYFLLYSKLSIYFQIGLGKETHQKIVAAPQIGYWPNLRAPSSFNEKVLHRKLHTNNVLFSTVEDKYNVREYVINKVGEHILPTVYQVTDDAQKLEFKSFPDDFVIKPTHLSGSVNIVKDNKVNEQSIHQQCDNWLSDTHSGLNSEYWYEDIPPKIIVEEFLEGRDGSAPLDYKFFVFHGKVEYIEVDSQRFTNHRRTFYDRNWERQDFTLRYPPGSKMDRPEKLEEMITVAEKLGEEFDFIRVDLYYPRDNNVYFGELTVAPDSGFGRFSPNVFDWKLGQLW